MYDYSPADTLNFHRFMLHDKVRIQKFLQSILQVVQPGDVVVDSGCGTGILAYFACLAGARTFYAIEQNPSIEIAKQICSQNGFSGRIEFINAWSTDISLPELGDILVTETIGNMGYEEGILNWVIDAKNRLLHEYGRIIPHSLNLICAPLENPQDYAPLDDWQTPLYGFDFSPARKAATHKLWWTNLAATLFLANPQPILQTNMTAVTQADICGQTAFTIQRQGLIHGIGGWFTAELAPGLTISNAPPNQVPSWIHGFLPLERPLPVKKGDQLQIEIAVKQAGSQWCWQGIVRPQDKTKPAMKFGPQLVISTLDKN